jgi:uroporphyrinogen-III synthase
MRVWVTRAQPGADATAERLRALGHAPVVAPLLHVRPLVGADLDLEGVGALAFTSANAVAAFAVLTPARRLPVYAVGEATAAAAREAGFAGVAAGEADVAALARLIAADPARPAGAVLHPCAAEPAGDLSGALAAQGVEARAAPVYAALPVDALPDLGRPPPEAVLVHSPKAARVLADLVPAALAAGLEAFALSAACAGPIDGRGFAALQVAPAPNEAALLALLPPA